MSVICHGTIRDVMLDLIEDLFSVDEDGNQAILDAYNAFHRSKLSLTYVSGPVRQARMVTRTDDQYEIPCEKPSRNTVVFETVDIPRPSNNLPSTSLP